MSSISASHRFRATLHVGLFWAAFALALLGLRQAPRLLGPGWDESAIASVLSLLSLAVIALLLRRERRSFADVGIAFDSGTPRRFFGGLVIGIAIAVAMLAIVVGLTSLRIESVANPHYGNALGFSLAVLLVLAYMEEIVFRSFSLVRLQEAWGIRAAIYVTAICFAFYHGPDPMNLLGPGVWGLLFGLAAVASRGIALPLGFHLGANWVQSLFELKTQYASGIWQLIPGPAAGLFSVAQVGFALQVILLVVAVVLIELYIRKKKQEKWTQETEITTRP